MIEGPQLIIILVILLLLFGGSKLPQLARSFGSAQREFKKGLSGDEDDEDDEPEKSKKTKTSNAKPIADSEPKKSDTSDSDTA